MQQLSEIDKKRMTKQYEEYYRMYNLLEKQAQAQPAPPEIKRKPVVIHIK